MNNVNTKRKRGRPRSPREPAIYKVLPEHRAWLREASRSLKVTQSALLGECIEAAMMAVEDVTGDR